MKKLNQKGQGMTEYILIVALIAIAAIAALKYFNSKTNKGLRDTADSISKAVSDGKTTGNTAP